MRIPRNLFNITHPRNIIINTFQRYGMACKQHCIAPQYNVRIIRIKARYFNLCYHIVSAITHCVRNPVLSEYHIASLNFPKSVLLRNP